MDADEQQRVNREAEERTVRLIRWALEHGADVDDAHAACWCACIPWKAVAPQINGRLPACIPSAANESEKVAGSRPA